MIHNVYLCDKCMKRCDRLVEWLSMETQYRKSTDVGQKFDLCDDCVREEKKRVAVILANRQELKKRMQDFV